MNSPTSVMCWSEWFWGLIGGVVSAFATAASGIIALPTVFSFTENGVINMLKMAAVPSALAFFLYLKTHPLPGVVTMNAPNSTITVNTPPVASSTVTVSTDSPK